MGKGVAMESVTTKKQIGGFSRSEIAKHLALFLLTLLTTTIAGMVWQNEYDLSKFSVGLTYSLSLLFILSCHEFGHFFAAQNHGIRVSLPYYTPFPPIPWIINFGTMGAVIRTREPITTRKALFDIGIAGPIAGFIASILILIVGFVTVPEKEFLLGIHPNYVLSFMIFWEKFLLLREHISLR
jgi:membrane-associated protease RseP (regulator of RpoE activity)